MINALTGIVLTAAVAAVIGTYIVTRRMLFISGGITHACFGGLGLAALAQIDIGPSRKPVFAVPDALAVAEQYDLLHGFRFHAFTGSGQTRLVSSLPA